MSAPVWIALLRGVNVGGHKKLAMSDLKATCESLGLTDVKTILQSGNVVFRGRRANAERLEKELGTPVILKTPEAIRRVIDRNPVALDGRNPGLLLVTFFDKTPPAEAKTRLQSLATEEEELHFDGDVLYVYYGAGSGRSKLANAFDPKKLGVTGTARNWNTVAKLLDAAAAIAG